MSIMKSAKEIFESLEKDIVSDSPAGSRRLITLEQLESCLYQAYAEGVECAAIELLRV